jgi:hypothetical protein
MQVTDDKGTVHRCIVGMPEYTSPELQGKDFNKEVRTANHDAFGLAVLIFQLLMQGFHPFTGRAKPGTPDVEQSHVYCIQQQIFPYLDNQPYEPPKVAPSFHALPPMLQLLFTRAFTQINNRPTPKEWAQVINLVEKRLVPCQNDPTHYYPSDGACVICEIDYNSGRRQRTSPAPSPTITMQVPLNQPSTSTTVPNPAPVSTPSNTTGPLRPTPISAPNTPTASLNIPPQPIPTTPRTPPNSAPNTSFSIPSAPMGGRLWWSWLLSAGMGLFSTIRRWIKFIAVVIVGIFLIGAIVSGYNAIVAMQNSSPSTTIAIPEPTLAPTEPPVTPTEVSIVAPTVAASTIAPTTVSNSSSGLAVCDPATMLDNIWPMLNTTTHAKLVRTSIGDSVASRFGPVIDVSSALTPPANQPVSTIQVIESCGSGLGRLIDVHDTASATFIGCANQACNTDNLLPVTQAYDVLIRSGDQQTINVSGRTSLLEQLVQRRTSNPALTVVLLRQTGFNQQTFANMVMPLLQKPLVTIRNNTVIWQSKTSTESQVSIPPNTKWYTPERNIVIDATTAQITQITHIVDLNGLTWQDGTQIMASAYIAWFESCETRKDTHPACHYVNSIGGSGSRLTITYVPGVPRDLAETIAPLAIRGGGNSTSSLLQSTTSQWRMAKPFDPTSNLLTDSQYTITIETYTDVQQFVARLRRNDTQIAIAEYQYAPQVLAILAETPLDGNNRLELVPTGGMYVVQTN